MARSTKSVPILLRRVKQCVIEGRYVVQGAEPLQRDGCSLLGMAPERLHIIIWLT
jgi:hypothetical protein